MKIILATAAVALAGLGILVLTVIHAPSPTVGKYQQSVPMRPASIGGTCC
jgi:hypothetical protein